MRQNEVEALVLNFPFAGRAETSSQIVPEAHSLPFAPRRPPLRIPPGLSSARPLPLTLLRSCSVGLTSAECPAETSSHSPSLSPLVPLPGSHIQEGQIKAKIMLWLFRPRSSFWDGAKGHVGSTEKQHQQSFLSS